MGIKRVLILLGLWLMGLHLMANQLFELQQDEFQIVSNGQFGNPSDIRITTDVRRTTLLNDVSNNNLVFVYVEYKQDENTVIKAQKLSYNLEAIGNSFTVYEIPGVNTDISADISEDGRIFITWTKDYGKESSIILGSLLRQTSSGFDFIRSNIDIPEWYKYENTDDDDPTNDILVADYVREMHQTVKYGLTGFIVTWNATYRELPSKTLEDTDVRGAVYSKDGVVLEDSIAVEFDTRNSSVPTIVFASDVGRFYSIYMKTIGQANYLSIRGIYLSGNMSEEFSPLGAILGGVPSLSASYNARNKILSVAYVHVSGSSGSVQTLVKVVNFKLNAYESSPLSNATTFQIDQSSGYTIQIGAMVNQIEGLPYNILSVTNGRVESSLIKDSWIVNRIVDKNFNTIKQFSYGQDGNDSVLDFGPVMIYVPSLGKLVYGAIRKSSGQDSINAKFIDVPAEEASNEGDDGSDIRKRDLKTDDQVKTSGSSSKGKKKSICYVVTAAYGPSSSVYENMILFKNSYLLKSPVGSLAWGVYSTKGYVPAMASTADLVRVLSISFLVIVGVLILTRISRSC